jgi:chitin disaccharide deacetylase
MTLKRLIVNADDFGMTPGVNRAVMEAHQNGILTSTTLMATGAAAEEAMRLAVDAKTLDVGCHVVLLEGTPILPAREIPSLAKKAPDGSTRFRRGFGDFIKAAVTNRLHGEDIYREAKAQITRLQQAGFDVLHIDTHKHAHVFPSVFRPLLRAAVDCGVRAVRNPFEPVRAMAWSSAWRRRDLWSRYVPVRMLRAFAEAFAAECKDLGLATPQGTFGITLTGFADRDSFLDLLNRVPEGTWELLCHPAYEDELWLQLGTRPGSGARELELLLSPAVRDCVRDNGIVLTSYNDLYAGTRAATAVAAVASPAMAESALGDVAAPAT